MEHSKTSAMDVDPSHGDSDLLQLLSQSVSKSSGAKDKLQVFENGAMVLSRQVLDCFPVNDLEAVRQAVNDDTITVTQAGDIHLMVGPWNKLVKAETKLIKLITQVQKKGTKRPVETLSAPPEKQQKTSANTTVHSSPVQNHSTDTRSVPSTEGELGDIPEQLQVKDHVKTYAKPTTNLVNPDSSRRSSRLSLKPRMSFAKLASGKFDEDEDEDENDIDQKPTPELGAIPNPESVSQNTVPKIEAKQEINEGTEAGMPSDIFVEVSVEEGNASRGENVVQAVIESAPAPGAKEKSDSQVVGIITGNVYVPLSNGGAVPVKRGRGRPRKHEKKAPGPSTIIILKKEQENLSDLSKVMEMAQAMRDVKPTEEGQVDEQKENIGEGDLSHENNDLKEEEGDEESDVDELTFDKPQTGSGTRSYQSKNEDLDKLRTFRKGRRGPKRKVPAATSTTCSECGFESRSITGMKTHMVTYHNRTEFECDVCLNRFGQRHLIQKHRPHHFDADGCLRESAILIHIAALEREGREENLSLELLRQVNAYREKLDEAKAKRSAGLTESGGGSKVGTTATESAETKSSEDTTQPESGTGAALENQDKLPSTPVKIENPDPEGATPSTVVHACPICNTKVTNPKYLLKHISAVHGTSKLQTPSVKTQLKKMGDEKERLDCPHCPFVCYRVQNFTRHLLSHAKPDFYKCDQCNYRHKSKGEVSRHKRNAHDEKKFRCEHCNIMLRNEVLLRTHVKMKHMWGLSVMCETCGKVLKTRSSYLKHKEIYHGNPDRKPGRVTCELCGRTLASQKTYEAHMEKCHSESPEGGLEEKAIAEGFVYNAEGPFSCKLCKYTNPVAREVRRHILRVHTQKDLQCDHCEARFMREAELVKHTRVYHMELEKKTCEFCNKTFLSNRYYQAHYNRIHSENKQYQCSFCKRQFYDKRTFIQHSELHKPEEERTWKYHCEQCQRRFRFKSNYDNHMLEHTGYRPFPCQFCTKSFKTKNILDRHMVTHSDDRPHVCSVCQKSFKLKKYLDIHLLSHTSDKFVCVYCGRIFVKEEALNKHICRYVAGKDGKPLRQEESIEIDCGPINIIPLRQETVEAAETVTDDTAQTVTLETIFPSAVDVEKFVCTNCGECFTQESEVASHDCSVPARIVSLKDDDGDVRYFCLNCSSEFQTEEESSVHQCQVVTVEPIAPETVARYSTMETLMGDEQTTTIVLESLEENVSVANMEEVIQDTENNAVLGSELETAPTEGDTLIEVSQNALVEFLPSGEEPAQDQPIGGEIEPEGEEPLQAEVYMCGLCQQIYQSEEEINLHIQEHVEQTDDMKPPPEGSTGIGIDSSMEIEGSSLVLDTGSLVVSESGMVIDGLAMEESIETTII